MESSIWKQKQKQFDMNLSWEGKEVNKESREMRSTKVDTKFQHPYIISQTPDLLS